MNTPAMKKWMNGFRSALLAVLAALAFGPGARGATISEPATIFYGQVIVSDAAQPYLLTHGTLEWTIQKAGGGVLRLRTALRAINDGEFSYRLNVPHEALAAGLVVSDEALPLGVVEQTHGHAQITIDGLPARLLGPAGSLFDASQARRSATHRMDLQLNLAGGDLDGDGLPDWWESRFGIDDANADNDGDGLNNLAEFRRGSNPTRDNRVPTLATRSIRAVANGTSVVLLHAVDADSAPEALVYTLTEATELGPFYLRNSATSAGNPDARIDVGGTFTQADINAARVIFIHQATAGGETLGSFRVALRDENPAHAASTNTVRLHLYRPRGEVAVNGAAFDATASLKALPTFGGFTADEETLVTAFALSRDAGHYVADGSSETRNLELAAPSSSLNAQEYGANYVPSYGKDRRHVLVGGAGHDRIRGSMESDLIAGGAGADRLRGHGGGDLFVLANRNDGNDTIEDFNPAENDRIDLSRVLTGTSKALTNYVQVVNTPSNSLLKINASGTGAPYGDLTLTVNGTAFAQHGLFNLVESGNVIAGDKALAPRVSIQATVPVASENGPSSGAFQISRTGPIAAELSVNLQVTGSAANGSDYRYVSPSVTFPAGQRTITVEITPYVDAITEGSEVVDIALLASGNYELAANVRAQVTIEDLMPLVSIDALEPIAVKNDGTPGTFLVTREGIVDRSLVVRLTIGGSATSGSDYQAVSSFINFAPWQTTAFITIAPKATATLSGGAEFVEITVRADAAYRVGSPSSARVLILEEQTSFGLWRDRHFPGSADALEVFATADPGNTGFRTIQRYAFGLNPAAPQNSPGRPAFKVRDNHLTVAFRRPLSIHDVQYVVEVSPDLVTWHSGSEHWETFAAPEFANSPEMVCYRAKHSLTAMPKLFMRVRVVYAP